MDNPKIAGYEILRPIGRGGMAIVYLAIQQSFDRHVALKVMSHSLLADPSFGERFLREARIVAQLSHRNVIQVYDVGAQGDNHYIAMEYMEGGDLKAKLGEGLPITECVAIVKEIATALDFAAAKGYVHRDIKPENILFRADGSAVLSDFGIARSTDSATQMTQAGTVIGTPLYMSPEQAQARELDGRSDLYSLGAIFFEMLTGHVPYDADSAVSISIKHVTDPIPRLADDLAAFQLFIDTALAKNPDDRFQTGDELKAALDDIENEYRNAAGATQVVTRKSRVHGATSGRFAGQTTASGSKRQRTTASRSGQLRANWLSLLPPANWWPASVLLVALASVVGWYVLPPGLQGRNAATTDEEAVPKRFDATIAIMLKNAENAMREGKLATPPEDNATYYYTTVLALAPDTPQALQGIERVMDGLLIRAERAIKENAVDEAKNWLGRVADIAFYSDNSTLRDRRQNLRSQLIAVSQRQIRQVERSRELTRLIAAAAAAVEADRLTSPVGDNAYEHYQSVLALDPDNTGARAGIKRIAGKFLAKAREAAGDENFARARAFVAAAVQIDSEHADIASAQAAIEAAENAQAASVSIASGQTQSEQTPLERLEREQAKKRTLIAKTLVAAQTDLENNRLSSPLGENAVEKYRDVLEIDPSNVDALEGLQLVGGKYIELARGMLDNANLGQADLYMRQAQTLSPNNHRLRDLQRDLLAAKDKLELTRIANAKRAEDEELAAAKGHQATQSIAQVLDRQSKAAQAKRADAAEKLASQQRAKIAQLLQAARAHRDAGRLGTPPVDNALEKYRAVLNIDSSNVQAKAGRRQVIDAIFQQTEMALENQRDAEAQQGLALLAIEAGKDPRLKSLQKIANGALGGAAAAAPVTARPPVATVATGETGALADKVEKAIGQRDYRLARKHYAKLKAVNPNYSEAAALLTRLENAELRTQQSNAILNEAQELIDTEYRKPGIFGSNRSTRGALKSSYTIIKAAGGIDPGNPRVRVSLVDLENKYATIIRMHADNKDYDRAREFLDDSKDMDLPAGKVLELAKIVADRKFKSTRPTGIF